MRKKLKKAGVALLLVLAVLAAWQWQWITYGVAQLRGQLDVVWNARPVDEVLQDPSFPDSLKTKLRLVQEIRRFAFDSLGISPSENYTAVYDQKGRPSIWVVTACEPYALEPHQWSYPFLGEMPYKGFFDSLKAVQEERVWKAKGLDTDIGTAAGWSTLGWFKDPILSSMLYRSPGRLANLIIHELTHGTLFVKDNVEYNENLADFVGDEGTKMFLVHRFGKDSPEYRQYETGKQYREKYYDHVLRGAQRLDSLYGTFQPDRPTSEKDTLKNRLIAQIIRTADTLTIDGKPRPFGWTGPLPNNTFFMEYIRYRAQQNQFAEEFRTRFGSDFKKYFAYLKEKYPKRL
ncbi:MAG: aminopeptidase [Cytophagales bacterium]|nr:aminopeptidase [Cytophagales bacterium]